MPVLLALDGPAAPDLRAALDARDAETARAIVLRGKTIREVIARAREYGRLATETITDVHAQDTSFAELPSRYIDWALAHFATDPALVA
jgi:hypothetical protein